MSTQRLIILTLGPVAIVGFLYWTTVPNKVNAFANMAENASTANTVDTGLVDDESLRAACNEAAAELATKLSRSCNILVRSPYVLAGDFPKQILQRRYNETIVPTARALSTLYFDRTPHEPIVILMFSGEASYRLHSEKLDGRRRPNYSGYYQRSQRRVVLNLESGSGTLAHELTHALGHFDFPQMPEWFDEGLASLEEQSEISDDGLRLTGYSNWRLNYILPAMKQNRLRPLETLISSERVRPGSEAIDYAHARYLCLYLQQRQLLAPYYRKFRANVGRDPSGLYTLQRLLGTDSLDALDRDFRKWLLTLAPRR